MWRRPVVFVLAGISVLAAACGGGSGGGKATVGPKATLTPQLRQLVDAARREGRLDLIFSAAATDDDMAEWVKGFKAYYGLNIAIHNTADPVMPQNAAKLQQELNAGKSASTDVYFGVAVFIQQLTAGGAVKPHTLDGLPNLRGIAEGDGSAVTLATNISGITYNTNKVKGKEVPKTLADVLRLPSRVRVASTIYAGTLAALPRIWDVDRALRYDVALSKRVAGLIGCGEESRIVSGEFDMLVTDCGDSSARRLAQQGAPAGHVVPKDAAFLNRWYLTVPVHAAHPNAAKLWVNYLLSRPGQDILWKHELLDNPASPGSRTAARISDLRRQGYRLIDTDLATQNRYANLVPLETCIQDVLGKQADAAACRPYRAQIQAAGG